jgi:8-oxo-dGTP pyrophosphatase MutT (NUDIX family)
MNTPPPREVACAILLDGAGRLLLQQRDDIPGIVEPGKIGLFGGRREPGETFLQCVVREIHEEISYYVPPEHFHFLITYKDLDEAGGASVHVEYFVARDLPLDKLIITEGSLLIIAREQLASVEPRFSPSTRFAISAFLNSTLSSDVISTRNA